MPKKADKFQRTYEELEQVASKFWPSELSEIEASLSVIPILLKTQDQFLSIISVETPGVEQLFEIVQASSLPANLFLKHLVILADFGGEMLKRVSNEFTTLFPNRRLNYIWRNEKRSYIFKVLPEKKFSNTSLHIDGKEILRSHILTDLQKDAIALLLFGSGYSDENQQAAATLAKCEVGEYLGKPAELSAFIKQRYIWVSRITGGAQANNLGQIAQKFVARYIEENMRVPNLEIKPGGRLPGVTHTDPTTGRLTSFDLVLTNRQKFVAVEVCFQVTTNSTIERKAGQARSRYMQVKRAGHKIAYVIDGAGNFERDAALRVICSFSDCTVAFSRNELDLLCEFLQETFS